MVKYHITLNPLISDDVNTRHGLGGPKLRILNEIHPAKHPTHFGPTLRFSVCTIKWLTSGIFGSKSFRGRIFLN